MGHFGATLGSLSAIFDHFEPCFHIPAHIIEHQNRENTHTRHTPSPGIVSLPDAAPFSPEEMTRLAMIAPNCTVNVVQVLPQEFCVGNEEDSGRFFARNLQQL